MLESVARFAPTALVIDGVVFLFALAAWCTRSLWMPLLHPEDSPASVEKTVGGRHRLGTATAPYRPHPAVPVVPGPSAASQRLPMPVTEPAWHRTTPASEVPMPPAPDATDWTVTLWDAAAREDWARARVAAAGKSWTTHMAKFTGAVVRRPATEPATGPATPDDWFGDHLSDTRQLHVAP